MTCAPILCALCALRAQSLNLLLSFSLWAFYSNLFGLFAGQFHAVHQQTDMWKVCVCVRACVRARLCVCLCVEGWVGWGVCVGG